VHVVVLAGLKVFPVNSGLEHPEEVPQACVLELGHVQDGVGVGSTFDEQLRVQPKNLGDLCRSLQHFGAHGSVGANSDRVHFELVHVCVQVNDLIFLLCSHGSVLVARTLLTISVRVILRESQHGRGTLLMGDAAAHYGS
jgi:hypothetical protein